MDSLAVQWLGPCPSTAEGSGSIPGWGTKIRQAEEKKREREREKAETHSERSVNWPKSQSNNFKRQEQADD